MGDAVVVAVAEEDGLAKHQDQRTRGVGEETVDGVVPWDDEVVAGAALGAVDGIFEPAMECAFGEFADGVGAGADGCDGKWHLVLE